jgi:hypothetical protein
MEYPTFSPCEDYIPSARLHTLPVSAIAMVQTLVVILFYLVASAAQSGTPISKQGERMAIGLDALS